jgi:hypothetical protein
VATANAGSTRSRKKYEMKYTDDHGNVCVCLVEHPDIISNFFEGSNSIDKHNQSRQFDIALEKTWLTQDPYFRLATTLIGMNVVGTINPDNSILPWRRLGSLRTHTLDLLPL